MYGQTSFNASTKNSSAALPAGLTALLLGLIVFYQVVNQIFSKQSISHEDGDGDSDASCTAQQGPSGYSCMEAKLFQGWQESPEHLEGLLKISPSAAASSSTVISADGSLAPATEASSTQKEVGADAKPEGLKDSGTLPMATEAKPQSIEDLLWDLAFQMGGGDKGHSAPDKHHHMTKPKPSGFMAKEKKPEVKKESFGDGLVGLQKKLEAKMQRQAKKHQEHRKIRALSHAARHSNDAATATDNMTPWAHDLDELTHELEAQITTHMKTWQTHHSTNKKKAEDDGMTPWAHNLEDTMHHMEEDMEHRKKERAEHAAAVKAAHAARLAAVPKSDFMDEIDALGAELCNDPARHDRPSCAQFLHPHAASAPKASAEVLDAHAKKKEAHENAMAHIKLLEKHLHELETDREHDNEEIKNESTEFLKELCADPARHDYPACAKVLAKTASNGRLRATKSAPASSNGEEIFKFTAPAAAATPEIKLPHVLHWAPMNKTEAAQRPHHVDAAPLVMQRQQLRALHWEGAIPSVACVTVLPEGHVTETLMRYFMDNYNLQHYEGKRELVLVYSSTDKEASRIAHLYADGASIKAGSAVTHGGDGFPSATAFRYGAWLAHDADLVVRYDFEAWHHPNRLSMQVRAMTLSKRPASLVTMVTAFDNDGKKATVAGGSGPHGSMMGEASWMRKHWMPLLEEETTVLHGLHSSDVAQVAMPELLAYHDINMLGVTQPGPAEVQA